MSTRYQFTLSRYPQPAEEWRENIRKMSREIRKTRWHPKYRPGQYVLISGDEHGRIAEVSHGIPPGYIVVMSKSRYHAVGQRVFIPETMIRAHRRKPPAHASRSRRTR